MKRSTTLFLFMLMMFASATSLMASINGITGRTTSGCASGCHSAASTATNVFLREGSGPFTMAPGESKTFKAVVAHASMPKSGINISVKNSSNANAGTFSGLINCISGGGELKHSSPVAMSGGESEYTFTWTAPSTTGTYTIRAAGNAINDNGNESGDFWNFMTNVTINVQSSSPTITITSQNSTLSYCRLSPIDFTWTGSNLSGNTSIEYSETGTAPWVPIASVPAAQLSYTWTVPAGLNYGVNYKFRVLNSTAIDTTNATSIIAPTPVISVQPNPFDSVCTGGNKTISVTMEKDATLFTYQWYKDNAQIPGATSSSYVIINAQNNNAGLYKVVVNGCSMVTSLTSQVVVLPNTAIVTQPIGKALCPTEALSLSIAATGTNLQYVWKKNGAIIPNATNSTYAISSVTDTDAGTYTCTVTGQCGSAMTSSNAVISVIPTPITNLAFTKDTSLCAGSSLTIKSTTTGGSIVEYIWKKNGMLISNPDTALTFSSIAISDSGTYSVSAKNSCGATSPEKTVKVIVLSKPLVLRTTADTIIKLQTELRLRTIISGDQLRYQWKKNGNILASDTNAVFVRQLAQYADSGSYTCDIINKCGLTTTSPIKVTVEKPLSGPSIGLKIAELNFGCIDKGTTKDSLLNGFISNTGDQLLNVGNVVISGTNANEFSFKGEKQFSLNAGESKSFTITYSPMSKSNAIAEMTISSNATASSKSISLSGVSCFEDLSASNIFLGTLSTNVFTKDTTIKITNKGTKAATIVNAGFISGLHFQVKPALSLPMAVQPNADFEIPVSFSVIDKGDFSDTLKISSTTTNYSMEIKATVLGSNGVEEEMANSILVFPQPAQQTIHIEGIDANLISSIALTDIFGKEYIIQSGKTIDISSFTNGMWLISITLNNGNTILRKLLIAQ